MPNFQNGKPFPPDEVCNPNFDSLLKVFHAINLDGKDAKEKCSQLKEFAKTKTLTDRQYEGIIDRCNNVINDTYGSTSRMIPKKD